MRVTPETAAAFRRRVLDYYHDHGRTMPWRETYDAYRILVSEVMLQQTQVSRVTGSYESFLQLFPDVATLAGASLEEVLRAWQGLGYNRRAVRLKQAAEIIRDERGGVVPCDYDALVALPGIGPTTAAGVMTFACGEPHLYIETNVRAALIHDFFADEEDIPDTELVPVFEAVLDRSDPRTWLYALMDFGSHLKRTMPNPSRRSRHHTRQTPFEGSRRQRRSLLLRAVMAAPGSVSGELAEATDIGYEAASELLEELAGEGFLARGDDGYEIA